MSDFGVIVACSGADYSLAIGCCASVRHFLGDVPLCLVADGSFSTREAEQKFGARVLRREMTRSDVLRARSWGSPRSKMVIFWESPFERFLYLDADTVVWGDVLAHADFDRYDMVIDRDGYDYDAEFTRRWIFDPDKVQRLYPDFQCQGRPYVCTGAFFGTRGLFDLDEYCELLDLQQSDPTLFFGGEQGLLNLMIFRAADAGRLRLGSADFQVLLPDFPKASLEERFRLVEGEPQVADRPAVLHWCGPKPLSFSRGVFTEPMTAFRLRAHGTGPGWARHARLWAEDAGTYLASYRHLAGRSLRGALQSPSASASPREPR